MELESVTKMPPQRLLLIVGGGIAAGLLWRKFSGKSSGGGSGLAADAADGSLSYPEDFTGYPMDTAGNLGGNRRDQVGNGYFPLPAYMDAEGNQYAYSDGELKAIDGPLAQPGPSGSVDKLNPLPAVRSVNNQLTDAANGLRGVDAAGRPFMWVAMTGYSDIESKSDPKWSGRIPDGWYNGIAWTKQYL